MSAHCADHSLMHYPDIYQNQLETTTFRDLQLQTKSTSIISMNYAAQQYVDCLHPASVEVCASVYCLCVLQGCVVQTTTAPHKNPPEISESN